MFHPLISNFTCTVLYNNRLDLLFYTLFVCLYQICHFPSFSWLAYADSITTSCPFTYILPQCNIPLTLLLSFILSTTLLPTLSLILLSCHLELVPESLFCIYRLCLSKSFYNSISLPFLYCNFADTTTDSLQTLYSTSSSQEIHLHCMHSCHSFIASHISVLLEYTEPYSLINLL